MSVLATSKVKWGHNSGTAGPIAPKLAQYPYPDEARISFPNTRSAPTARSPASAGKPSPPPIAGTLRRLTRSRARGNRFSAPGRRHVAPAALKATDLSERPARRVRWRRSRGATTTRSPASADPRSEKLGLVKIRLRERSPPSPANRWSQRAGTGTSRRGSPSPTSRPGMSDRLGAAVLRPGTDNRFRCRPRGVCAARREVERGEIGFLALAADTLPQRR